MRVWILLLLYVAGLLTEIAGVALVIRDIRHDARRADEIANRPAPDELVVQDPRGFEFRQGGIAGAFAARQAQDVAAFRDFVNDRLTGGNRGRWFGVALVLAGAVLGFAGNIASTLWSPPS